jgi:hypothetical protein
VRLAQSPCELSSPVPHIRCAELGQLWLNPIMSNVGPVRGVLIHNAQFPTWRGRLFPPTGMAPPEGDEHEDNAADDESLHSVRSLLLNTSCKPRMALRLKHLQAYS